MTQEITAPKGQNGIITIPGKTSEQQVLNVPINTFIDASQLVVNTNNQPVQSIARGDTHGNYLNSTIRFNVENPGEYSNLRPVISTFYPEARGQTVFGDTSGLPAREQATSYVSLQGHNIKTDKDETLASVRLGAINKAGIQGGNRDFSDTIQIKTPDGKIQGFANPEIASNAQAAAQHLSMTQKLDGKTGEYDSITPEIIDRAKQSISSAPSKDQLTPEQSKALATAKAAADALKGQSVTR